MHSISNRLNAVFFYGVFSIAILCGYNILTTIFLSPNPEVTKFQINENFTLYKNPYTGVQHARSYFDLNVDLSKTVNWNNHITFMWISAEYETGKIKNKITKATIYDDILPRNNPSLHLISLKNKLFEYPLIDAYNSLAGKKVVFKLNWEHMPVIGPILKYSKEIGSIELPKEESKPISLIMRSEYNYENINEN